MDEINLNWPMDLPAEWMPVIKQRVEKSARSQIESVVGPSEMGTLLIEATGSSPADLKLRVQGPPWLLQKIAGGLTS